MIYPLVVLWDLDSTLRNTLHRAHLGAEPPHSHEKWIAYSRACVDDPPIRGTVALFKLLHELGAENWIISGSNEEARAENIEWLQRTGLVYDSLRLRGPEDIQHNGLYKAAYVRELREQGIYPVAMFEDHQGVAELVEAEGVPVVLVNPGYVDPIGVNFHHLAPILPAV